MSDYTIDPIGVVITIINFVLIGVAIYFIVKYLRKKNKK